MHRTLASLLAASLLAGCGHGALTATPVAAGLTNAQAAAHEVLVKPRKGQEGQLAAAGYKVARSIPALGWQVVTVSGDASLVVANLKKQPWVAAVELQRLVHPPKAPTLAARPQTLLPAPAVRDAVSFNDPDLAKCNEYQRWIGIQQAWAINTSTPSMVVAVLDTGVDAGHPELKNQLVPGYDAMNDNTNPRDDNSHGTACAGVVAAEANNGVGVVGLAPHSKVMPIKVLDRAGNGPLEVAAKGLVWAADHGAKIATMSFGEDAPSQVLQDAIDYARSKDMVLIAAMGNDGEEMKHWPACSDGVLAVGAIYAEDDTPALFTTEGSWVGICAPGDRVWTSMPTYPTPGFTDDHARNYDWFSGTSAAAPIVGAVAALVRTQFPQLNEAQVRARLRATARDVGAKGFDDLTGDGCVDALKALTAPL